MKYLLKNESKKDYWFSLSKKPALGAAFFAAKAERHVEMNVWPKTFDYLPPGGHPGKPYLMTGATKRDFVAALLRGMRDKNPERLSEWVAQAVEKTQKWVLLDCIAKMDPSEREELDILMDRQFREELDTRRISAVTVDRWVEAEERLTAYRDWQDEQEGRTYGQTWQEGKKGCAFIWRGPEHEPD